MKKEYTGRMARLAVFSSFVFLLLLWSSRTVAQDSTAPEPPPKPKPVKNTFQSQWIIDNQTILVPVKGTLEVDFQHRFGVVGNGYQDFWGLFSPSFNIRF